MSKVRALWKYDKELGIAYLCPKCKRFVCMSGPCKCGTIIDLELERNNEPYKGNIIWD